MYDNIGGKIKGLAKTMFMVEVLGAVITGIVLCATDDLSFAGLLTLFVGPIIAWVSSWILYAFGELVEDVHAMRNNVKNSTIEKNTENIALEEQETKPNDSSIPSNFNTIEEKWEFEVSQLSDEELQKRCGQWLEWSKEYRAFCRQELKKRGL